MASATPQPQSAAGASPVLPVFGGPRAPGAFFPAHNQAITIDRYPLNPFDPRSAEMSLHQLNARSPRRIPLSLEGFPPPPSDGRYYQAVKALVVGPTLVGSGSRNLVFDFELKEDVLVNLARTVNTVGTNLPASGHFEGSLRYRFRMCAVPASQANAVTEDKWVTMATSWPDQVFVTFNKTAMPVRKKSHHGQPQPVELTQLVHKGPNHLQLSVLQVGKAKGNVVYFAAIEQVETRGSDSIKRHIFKECTIPTGVTSKLVADRLKGGDAGGDEVVITDNTVSIDLSDPFTMRMFTVPVRGATCTHLECFDLDMWLSTRSGKPVCQHRGQQTCEPCRASEKLGPEPTLADAWKCPICSGDARPRSLRVDLFLKWVRDELCTQGKEMAKSISVHPDGSWTPKIEEDVDSDGDDEPVPKRRKSGVPPSLPAGVEVIELD